MLKNLRFKPILYTITAMALLAMTACHAPKTQYSGNVDTEMSTANSDELFIQMAESYSTWTDLYVPVSFRLNRPKQIAVSGRATMVYGKEINISLRMLGMELGVIYVNETTLYVVDKYHKMYLKEDIGDILAGYNLTLVDLQNILLGRVTDFGNGTITDKDAKNFIFMESEDLWVLTPKVQRKGTDLHYIATKTDPPVLSDVALRIADKGMVNLSYTEPTSSPAGIICGILTAIVPYKDAEVEASMIMDLDQAKWNEGRSINFKQPSDSYKRIDAETLLKSF